MNDVVLGDGTNANLRSTDLKGYQNGFGFYESSYHSTQNMFALLIHKYNFICN
jgi:hypothetical protein